MKKIVFQIAVFLTFFSAASFAQNLAYKVAEDNLGVEGQQAHLWESTKNYRFSEKEIPLTVLEENSPYREVVVASEYITMRYIGAKSDASYSAEITFLSNDSSLVQQIFVDQELLESEVNIPVNKVNTIKIDIPKNATYDGAFDIIIRKTKGDWVAASSVTVFSDADIALKTDDYLARIKIPRISPIPIEVQGVGMIMKNLDGIWKFNPSPEKEFEKMTSAEKWKDIKVPGEWSMQRFKVLKDSSAGYFRSFTIPADWKGKRIKLRFNSVYSDATIYVNGKKAGSHMGGFTVFELDVTKMLKYNSPNTLVLAVKNESLANDLSSASRYACHPLGGIQRSVNIFALPKINISGLAVQTTFDNLFQDATLSVNIDVQNESLKDISGLYLKYELTEWKSSDIVTMSESKTPVQRIKAGQAVKLNFLAQVKKPKKWDSENPNLYVLTCKLLSEDGKVIETVQERFGFRQVDVFGNQLFVNGMPIKLRGVNRHEVYPLTGRSIPKEMYRKDLELFLEGNVNHIRTSHYPPDETLMELADEMGMFIECEGPFCWSHNSKEKQDLRQSIIIRQNLENVILNRNHPSIIFWSLANESYWNNYYNIAGKAVKSLDPSRPITFNFFPWSWVGMHYEDEHICQIASDHYPGLNAPKLFENHNRPVNFGEFVHLNAYNRYELASDVALRDKWGIYLHKMWEEMFHSKGCLGGSIWAGIDDTFYWDYINEDGSVEERTVGYGTWGPIDGWRRKKPEWWGMKKTFSPVRILDVEQNDSLIIVHVENRQDFSNLNRLDISWKIEEETGKVTTMVNPKSKGQLIIQAKKDFSNASSLQLSFDDPRGFNVDSFNIVLREETLSVESGTTEKYKLKESDGKLFISGIDKSYTINSENGLFENKDFTGPHLMILPLTDKGNTQMHGPTKYYEPFTQTCSDWKLSSIDIVKNNRLPVITVRGEYKEAEGRFIYSFNADGSFSIDYDFTVKEDVNPRQLGIVFKIPNEYEQFSWKRKGYWTTYPGWHIARLEGSAKANEGFEATPVGPRTKPNHEWRHDRTKIGSNDFASTKHNIYQASLTNKTGKGIQVLAKADKHCRVWIDGEFICMLIADYSNGGSERFLRPHTAIDDRPLKVGDKVSGKVKFISNTYLE